jgi:MFS transporter, OFA family, oxalate/formate antiporter
MLLATAKGMPAFLVPFANGLNNATGDWGTVFLVAAGMNVLVVVFALGPICQRHHRRLEPPGLRAG